ncbi:kelch repeat-containing protein [Variovorax sp. J22R133]|uniref:Kelch repeat-containing protein n=1 Tax=Variovorax brevis TaxID=3053503 RepID=UPI002578BDFF|nr:kelch repeat-containing protein [Variovorax sp. J22R133]MDM0112748.1 kelch repeat-containing protein [Variovorax sp. J22R133]
MHTAPPFVKKTRQAMNEFSWTGALRLMARASSILVLVGLAACGGDNDASKASGCWHGVANPVPPAGLHYTRDAVVYELGQQVDPNAPTHSAGPIDRYTVDPALPDGLSMDPVTGIISGTPKVLAAPVVHAVTGSSACGSTSTSLQIAVITGRPLALRYANDSVVYVVGQAIIPNKPRVLGQVDTYTVEPTLPAGLVLDPRTGVISGTPASPSVASVYAVKATNSRGSTVGRIQIEVADHVLAPESLKYSQASATYEVGLEIPPNAPVTSGGEITLFTVVPSLPAGLSLDPRTGVIDGTPAAAQPATQYAVTGANSVGSVQTIISIAVEQTSVTEPPIAVVPPASVAYNDAVYVVGQPIVPNVPTLTGGAPTLFAVSPDLPDGLGLDPVTGAITGAPTTPQRATAYTVTASNAAGQAQTTLTLTVTEVGTWMTGGSLNQARTVHTASLRPDGTVLVAGGFLFPHSVLNLVEIRGLAGIWAASASMTVRRFAHTSTTLQDGRVLVVGGVADSGSVLDSVEVFDTQWSPVAPMTLARTGHTATLLNDGRVLVAGGANATAEVYNPGDGTWARVASMNEARADHTAVLLQDGRVLVAGGEDRDRVLASAEVYDPIADTWTLMPPMSRPRGGHTASLLLDGSVLVAGGGAVAQFPTDEAELFVSQAVGWQPVQVMKKRRASHTATTLPNGQVVVAGGTGLNSTTLSSVEIFDPASKQWLAAADMAEGRRAHTATLLPDGRLLVVGGQGEDGSLASTELFDASR